MDERLEHEMEEVLDGVATAEETAALRERLGRDADARARFHEMESLFSKLGKVGMVDPPHGLRNRVLGAIEVAPPRTPARRARVTRLRPTPQGLRYAAVFAAGAAAATLIVAVGVVTTPRGTLPVAGTMFAPNRGETSALLDRKQFALGRTRVAAETRRAGNDVLARFETRSPEPVEISIDFDPDLYRPAAMEWSRPAPSGVAVRPGNLRFENQGDAWFAVSLESRSETQAPIHMTIRSRDGSTEEVLETSDASR